jgi:hypothetical protein
MSSTSEKRFPFKTLLSFGNSKKSTGAKSGEYSGWSLAEMLFLLKTATHEAKNVLACCHGKKSMSDVSTALLACSSQHQ